MLAPIRLHADGPEVSHLVLGAWRFVDAGLDAAAIRDLVAAAVDLGITTVDHADVYGDYQVEARFGEALRDAPDLRRRLQVVTKCDIKLVSGRRPAHRLKHYDTSRAHITASVDASLQALGVERIDLLLLHRPDPLMDADETAGALDALIAAGKVAHVGVSNFGHAQFELLASRLQAPLATHQIELSLLHPAPFIDGTLDDCQRRRIAPMAWSPLGGGRLFRHDDAVAGRVRAALEAVRVEIGAGSIEQVAYAWLLAHPARIVPVTGTTRIERLRDAAQAVQLRLDRLHWFTLWEAANGQPVP
jgi:predicted oxidoreductase